MKQLTHYNVAIYCRLSRDDGNFGDSSSIQSQKLMLTEYVKSRNWNIVEIYSDDGFSGTSFERPALQKMLTDIDDKKINCVVCKDLSRLGRNYLLVGQLTDMVFPAKNIRCIGVGDNYDNINEENNSFTPILNWANEQLARETSKKVKAAKVAKAKNGSYINSLPPFGYEKDPNNRNHLIIDEPAAVVVRRIFDLYIKGESMLQIARILQSEKVLTRGAYSVSKGVFYFERFFTDHDESKKYNWAFSSIRAILKDKTYTGSTISFKCGTVSFRDQRCKNKPEEDWLIIPGTHEAIIDADTWEIAQNQRKTRRLAPKLHVENEFVGIAKCGDCGRTMVHRAFEYVGVKTTSINRSYCCGEYKKKANADCSPHYILHKNLYTVVLESIKKYACLTKENKALMAQKLAESGSHQQSYEINISKKELKSSEKRQKELNKIVTKLYEDYANEKINNDNYQMLMDKYQTEQAELKIKIADYKRMIEKNSDDRQGINEFIAIIEKFTNITELTHEILVQLIDKVLVYERKIIDGNKTQQIDIYWRFVGKVNLVP